MWSVIFFCVKQNTAYEMLISDWSSDVCSYDLRTERHFAIIICTAVTLCGLALFAAAPGDPLAVHGFIVLVARDRSDLLAQLDGRTVAIGGREAKLATRDRKRVV